MCRGNADGSGWPPCWCDCGHDWCLGDWEKWDIQKSEDSLIMDGELPCWLRNLGIDLLRIHRGGFFVFHLAGHNAHAWFSGKNAFVNLRTIMRIVKRPMPKHFSTFSINFASSQPIWRTCGGSHSSLAEFVVWGRAANSQLCDYYHLFALSVGNASALKTWRSMANWELTWILACLIRPGIWVLHQSLRDTSLNILAYLP